MNPATKRGKTLLTICVAQMALAGELGKNLGKIIHDINQANAKNCRVVIFPEGALTSSPGTKKIHIDRAIAEVCDATRTYLQPTGWTWQSFSWVMGKRFLTKLF